MMARALIAAALIVAAGMYSQGASRPENVPPRVPLSEMPAVIGPWHGADSQPFDDDVVAQLGVDDYINRQYVAGGVPIALYVGYYASQRQGDTMHSPQNCLPGAGWRPVLADRTRVAAGDRSIPLNRFVIQKGLDRLAVFYWYQGRGRIVANEFANKGWLMLDAARLRRTDGGLVRLITPVADGPDAAFATLTAFSVALIPQLPMHLP